MAISHLLQVYCLLPASDPLKRQDLASRYSGIHSVRVVSRPNLITRQKDFLFHLIWGISLRCAAIRLLSRHTVKEHMLLWRSDVTCALLIHSTCLDRKPVQRSTVSSKRERERERERVHHQSSCFASVLHSIHMGNEHCLLIRISSSQAIWIQSQLPWLVCLFLLDWHLPQSLHFVSQDNIDS